MNRYKHLFFDFDNTLIDFSAAEKVALPAIFEEYGVPFTDEVAEFYKILNGKLWKDLEKGLVTKEELFSRRFGETMEHFGKKIDGRKMDEEYRDKLSDTIVYMDGAEEVIEQLSKHFKIYIATNGMVKTQRQRLAATSFESYITRMFVSEETNYQKPQKQFFEYIWNNLNIEPSECLMIGDSYSADMMGGYYAGIDTCWYNPNMKEIQGDHEPTYTISSLYQLVDLLISSKVK